MTVQTEHLDAEILNAIQGILAHHLPDADDDWLQLAAKRRLYGPGINLSDRIGASCDAILSRADGAVEEARQEAASIAEAN